MSSSPTCCNISEDDDDYISDLLGNVKLVELPKENLCVTLNDESEVNNIAKCSCLKDSLDESERLMKESESWFESSYPQSEVKPLPKYLTDSTKDSVVEELSEESPYHLFVTLPDEILLRIFSFFTQRDLCSVLSRVCSTWFRLSKDPTLWLTIYAKDYENVSSKLLCKVLTSWCGQVTTLQLNKRPDITFTDFELLFMKCRKIKKLSLAFCSQVNSEILMTLSKYCKSLRMVSLEGCVEISDNSLYYLIGLPLTQIDISYCNNISDEGGIFLVRNFMNLYEVNLDGIQWISDNCVERLVAGHNKTIHDVFLDGENLTDQSVQLLSTCKNLRSLGFSFCSSLTDNSLDFISQCHNLKYLKLRKGSNFTCPRLERYLQQISTVRGSLFTYLCLAECTSLSNQCLVYIGEKFVNLIVLDLSWCWECTDDGLSCIISNCHKLRKLHLQGLHTLQGFDLLNAHKHLPNLQFLDLSQCNKVKEELIECVVKRSKNLIVLNYYGDMVFNCYGDVCYAE